MNRTFKSLIFKIFLTALCVVAWAQLIAYSVLSGFLWTTTKYGLAKNSRYIAANQIMTARDLIGPLTIIIGTKDFQNRIPDSSFSAHPLRITLPRPELSDILNILSALRSENIDQVLLQSLPYYWSDIQPLLPPQDLSLIDAFNRPEIKLFPLKYVHLAFQTLRDASKPEPLSLGDAGDDGGMSLKGTLDDLDLRNAVYMVPGKSAKSAASLFKANFPAQMRNKTYWLGQSSDISPGLSPEDLQKMKFHFANKSFHPDFGHFEPIDRWLQNGEKTNRSSLDGK